MKFEFKSLSVYEEERMPNYVANGRLPYVTADFDSMEAAINYVAEHKGFLTTADGSRAFEVRNIQAVD